MSLYLVTMEHPDDGDLNRLEPAHAAYLKGLVAEGKVRAGGALVGAHPRASFLIFSVKDRAEVARLVMDDPFFSQDMVLHLSIREWVPQCGSFGDMTGAA